MGRNINSSRIVPSSPSPRNHRSRRARESERDGDDDDGKMESERDLAPGDGLRVNECLLAPCLEAHLVILVVPSLLLSRMFARERLGLRKHDVTSTQAHTHTFFHILPLVSLLPSHLPLPSLTPFALSSLRSVGVLFLPPSLSPVFLSLAFSPSFFLLHSLSHPK